METSYKTISQSQPSFSSWILLLPLRCSLKRNAVMSDDVGVSLASLTPCVRPLDDVRLT